MLRQVTVVVDNTVGDLSSCVGQHGYSLFVETSGGRYLFDTGRDELVLQNAESLGIDLCKLDAIILSHGHFDHTGGLRAVIKKVGPIDVYAHSEVFRKRIIGDGKNREDIGIPFSQEQLENLGARFHLSRSAAQISDDTWVTGEIPQYNSDRSIGEEQFIDERGRSVRDRVVDDQAVFVDDGDGLNIFLGCGHAGLSNTIIQVMKISSEKRIKLLLGGMHLVNSDQHWIAHELRLIKEYQITLVAPAHCTGFSGMAALAKEYEGHFACAFVGSTFGPQANAT